MDLPQLLISAEVSDSGNSGVIVAILVGLLILTVVALVVAAWVANFFGLARAVKSNNSSLIVLHAIGIVVGLLGSVLGAIYFFKWRHEPVVSRVHQDEVGDSMNVADELRKLAALRDSDVITHEEFELRKKKLLAN